jgi:hypothetical protein
MTHYYYYYYYYFTSCGCKNVRTAAKFLFYVIDGKLLNRRIIFEKKSYNSEVCMSDILLSLIAGH